MSIFYSKIKEENEQNKKILERFKDLDYYTIVENNSNNKLCLVCNNEYNTFNNKASCLDIDSIQDILLPIINGKYITNLSKIENLDLPFRFGYEYILGIKDILGRLGKIDKLEIKRIKNLEEYLARVALMGGKILKGYEKSLYVVLIKNNITIVSDRILKIPYGTSMLSFNYLPCKIIKIDNIDISNVVSLNTLFKGCTNLVSVELKNFDTSNVRSMNEMFAECISLKKVNIGDLDTKKLNECNSMFSHCESLEELDLSKMDTHCLVYCRHMFIKCIKLKKLDISTWKTPVMKDCSYFLKDCVSLESVNLENMLNSFLYSNIQTNGMLHNCVSMTDIKPEYLREKTGNWLGQVI